MYYKIFSIFLTFIYSLNIYAQKPPLDHTVYDDWKNIGSPQFSKSGNLLFYSINPQEGDALIEIKTPQNQLVYQIPRGYNVNISENDLFAVGSIKPKFSETREAKIKKKKPDEMPKDSLFVLDIKQKRIQKFPLLKSFKTARNHKAYFAFISEVDTVSKKELVVKDATDTTSTAKKSAKKAKPVSALHLYELTTGDTIRIMQAEEYFWSDDEKYLVYSLTVDKKDSTSNKEGLYIYDTQNRSTKKISNGKGSYKAFRFDDAQRQLTFLADKSPEKALQKDYKLYYYAVDRDTAQILVAKNTLGMPQNWYVSGDGNLDFSANGEKLFFGIAPVPLVKDTTLVEFEHAKVDIWHWQENDLQTQQLANLRRDQSKNFSAVVYLQGNTQVIPLSDETFSKAETSELANEEWVLLTTDAKNRIQYQWNTSLPKDVFLVSTITGERKQILPDLIGYAFMAPNAEYVVYFDQSNGSWNSYHIATEKKTLLNTGLTVSFVDEQNDMPTYAGLYGYAGWSEDGDAIYVYDRYDIWKFSLDGKMKKNVTKGDGRSNKTVFRIARPYIDTNPRRRMNYIGDNQELLLNAFNETDKQDGFYKLDLKKRNAFPSPIVMQPKTYRGVQSPENLKYVIYTKEDFQNSPDLYINGLDFKNEQRLTTINPQQSNYNWGSAELVHWTTPKGHKSEGILYKPEDFDPNKKYPIIAYFYEKLSDGLYTYQAPAPTPSRLNITTFVSNGYLVFAPDIEYEIGHPGRSAEEFINSGMKYLARTHSWVDSTKMGVQGQSWGGYQVAHLITRTDMYAAAWTGAPVVNMTSAYGGIRWGTGMSRQFQYERTQSRLGKTLWEDRDLYIENSPLFFMDRVTTPVAIMHNDVDGAVPWYQGIEMFTALRRLQKPAWLLNYNGDDHNLIQRQNRKDIQIRELQFFDHFLKGKPAANWIKKGVPAIHKGIDWGLEVDL